MVEAISNNAAGVVKTTTPATGTGKEAVKKEGFSVPSQESSAPISPRLRYDAVSGVVVTEFLDQGGSVQAQTPSTAVLAYLRAGLGEDGRNRENKG
jgi:hypothetical protein